MIIRTSKELSLYLPSHVMDSVKTIQGFIETSEQSFLVPVLGKSLYKELIKKYKEDYADVSLILPETREENDTWAEFITKCQLPVAFNALYRAADIIAVSVNEAGLNIMSSQGYDASPEKIIDRFKSSANKEAHQGIDQLLLFLEDDAQNDKVFTDLWKESRFYCLVSGRLINTASVFNQYVNIYDSREKFISLIPDISFCEDNYIRTEIGEILADSLIEKMNDGTLNKTEERAVTLLQTALSLKVEERNKMFSRQEAKSESIMSVLKACEYISSNQSEFLPAIESSPLYKRETPPAPKKTPEEIEKERLTLNPDASIFILDAIQSK